jgi:hypothetical protein
MRRIPCALALFVAVSLTAGTAWSAATDEITEATSQGRAVFLVVTQGDARGTDRAMQIANEAHALAPATAVVQVDRAAPENRELIESLRAGSAPVPLILVMASNGIVAGGALLKDATPQNLVATIPTPKKAEMLLHLSNKMAVFVVVGNEHMVVERGQVYEACNQAMQTLERRAATITVDMADKAEKAWLTELNVTGQETSPVTIVFNAKGQKTQVFRQVMTAAQLVEAVNKKVACCPGGSC